MDCVALHATVPACSTRALTCSQQSPPVLRQRAGEYDAAVPDTWHVINRQDAVARMGKWLLGAYKRNGNRAIVNARGDCIVRPTLLEASLAQHPFRRSIAHHLLGSYQASLLAIIEGQLRHAQAQAQPRAAASPAGAHENVSAGGSGQCAQACNVCELTSSQGRRSEHQHSQGPSGEDCTSALAAHRVGFEQAHALAIAGSPDLQSLQQLVACLREFSVLHHELCSAARRDRSPASRVLDRAEHIERQTASCGACCS